MQPPFEPAKHWLIKTVLFILVFLVFFSIPFLHGMINHHKGYGLASNRQAPDFLLSDQRGTPVSLKDFHGKFVFLMFGYLNCENVCHSQAILFQEINQQADKIDNIQFVYIGMDPERDSPAQLAAYFDRRGENFTSLSSDSLKNAQAIAGNYRSFFAKEKYPGAADYEITHPGLYFLIDPDGKLRFTYTVSQVETSKIVKDLADLNRKY